MRDIIVCKNVVSSTAMPLGVCVLGGGSLSSSISSSCKDRESKRTADDERLWDDLGVPGVDVEERLLRSE